MSWNFRDRDRDDLRNRVSRKRDGNESDPEAKVGGRDLFSFKCPADEH